MEVAEFLLDHGADVNAQDKGGLIPLHNASSYGHLDIAALLIKFNTVVNATDKWGFTPLHEAAQKGRTQLCALLVSIESFIYLLCCEISCQHQKSFTYNFETARDRNKLLYYQMYVAKWKAKVIPFTGRTALHFLLNISISNYKFLLITVTDLVKILVRNFEWLFGTLIIYFLIAYLKANYFVN